jgi:hypothetical protein
MADYVRVMIAIAAQWRVLQAVGPAASALVGVPVAGRRQRRRVGTQVATPGNGSREPKKGTGGRGK